MALLNFIPPALALILHHRGLFKKDTSGGTEQIEQSKVGLRSGWRNGREELPAGEDGSVTDTRREVSLHLDSLFAALECRAVCRAAAR